MRWRRPVRAGMVLAAAFACWAFAATAYVNGGEPGNGRSGCSGSNCHGVMTTAGFDVRLEGLPSNFTPGKAYPLNLSVSRPGMRPPGYIRAGFAFDARNSSLEPLPDDLTQRKNTTLTHTGLGARTDTWGFVWRAPNRTNEAAELSWTVLVPVNDSRTPATEDDVWVRFGATIEPETRPDVPHGRTPSPPVGSIALALVVAASLHAVARRS